MELTLADRFQLATILPTKGNYLELVTFEDIAKKIAITQEEAKEYDIKEVDSGGVKWTPSKVPESFSIDFTEGEKSEIIKILKNMDNDKTLDIQLKGLYKNFVLSTPPEKKVKEGAE